MIAFRVLDELEEVGEVVSPELVDNAELVDIAEAVPMLVPVDAGRDAEDETWFGQTVKVLLLFAACCSTA
jgi:hypothetical protein